MQYTPLGRTGLKVSRLCLGTMNFGPHSGEAESFAIMDEALELGVNFFDTANVYGGRTSEGITEQIIGRWLAQGGGRRERSVLATKVYGRMGDGPKDSRLSAYHVRRACDESLRTDHIDLYQMHHIDRETPWNVNTVLAQRIREAYEGSMGRFAAGPEAMARVVEKEISARRPRTRYPVTFAARVLMGLRRWLPDRAFDAFLRTQFPEAAQ